VIVLDASATLDGFFIPEYWPRLRSLIQSNDTLVPQHYLIECMNGLRRVDRETNLSLTETSMFKHFVEEMPFITVPTKKLTDAIWAKRHTMTAYDAHYVAIAQYFKAPLVTHDNRLANAASGSIKLLRLDTPAP
jgi:predicted nucleic acid-binding protein